MHVRINRRIITLGTVAALALGATAGSAGAAPTRHASATPEPVMGGHLDVSGDAEASSPWTPAAMLCDMYCYTRARSFFDSVAVWGADGEVHGMLAEAIEPNEDFSEWTVTIRDGISFTDGTRVDAAAVVRNLQDTGTGLVIGATVKDVARVPSPDDPEKMILKIDIVDDLTFTIFIGQDGDPEKPITWRDFPQVLTGQFGLIASPAWLDAVAENPELAIQPVGSGPFIVDSYEPRGSTEVSRNPDYWMTDEAGNQLPYLDSISFRVIESSETAVDALESGDIDIAGSSDGRAINRAMGLTDEMNVTLEAEYAETGYVMIDLDKQGPMQDRRVRCAMSLAIDRDEFNDSTSDGFNASANGLFSPGQQGYLEDNGLPMEQDLEAAAAMIAEYEEETGTDVELNLGHISTNSLVHQAELLMGWWTEIGIDMTDQAVPQNDFINLALFGTPDFEAFVWRHHGGVVVDQQYVWWHSKNAVPDGELSLNFGRIRDEGIDTALDAARQSLTDEEATAAAEEINRIFAEQCYYIPLNWQPWGVMSAPDVAGIGALTLPDGTPVIDGGGVPGPFWLHTVYLTEV